MVNQATASAQLKQLLDEDWEFRMQSDPLYATYTGDQRFNDRLPGMTEADFADRLAAKSRFQERLRGIDRLRLEQAERLNYDIFLRLLENEINELTFRAYRMPLSKTGGFHIEFPDLPNYTPFNTVQDFENYVRRLNGFRQYAAEFISLMREGLRQGQVPDRVTLEGVDEILRTQIVADPQNSSLYLPFQEFPKGHPQAEEKHLKEEAQAAIKLAGTGLQALLIFFSVLPAARVGCGSRAAGWKLSHRIASPPAYP
jgi:uncharacterized protein (DUF885 family)